MSMKNALTVFHRSIYDTYQNLGFVLWSTILWWLSVLPIFTLGPATAGLFYVIHRKRIAVSVGPSDFWYGFKKHFRIGTHLSFIYLLIVVPGVIYFYLLLNMNNLFAYIIGLIILYFLIFWHLLLLYALPILIEQEITRISVVLRRALRLVTENYFFSVNIVLYMFFMTILCSIITISLVVWAGLMAFLSHNALLYLLSKYAPDQYTFDETVNWKGSIKPWKK